MRPCPDSPDADSIPTGDTVNRVPALVFEDGGSEMDSMAELRRCNVDVTPAANCSTSSETLTILLMVSVDCAPWQEKSSSGSSSKPSGKPSQSGVRVVRGSK